MRYAAALVLALGAGCAREPYLYEAPDRIQLNAGQRCVIVDDPQDPPVGRCEVIEDPFEPDYTKMQGRKVLVRVIGGHLNGSFEKFRRANLRAED